jgi:DNA-directed RNA polymerase
MARQKHLEKSAYDVAFERLQQQAETLDSLGIHNPALNTSTLQKWMWEWHVKLRDRIKEEIKVISENEEGKKRRLMKVRSLGPGKNGEMLSPYLNLVNPERLSLITIMEIMRLQGTSGLSDGMKTARALISVGKAVEMEYKAQMIKRHQIYKEPSPQEEPQLADPADGVADSKSAGGDLYSQFGYKNLREKRLAVSQEIEGEEQSPGWSQVTRSKIGGILVDCLMEVAEVERTAKLESGEMVYAVSFVSVEFV